MQKDSIEALHQYWDSLVQEACLSSLTRVQRNPPSKVIKEVASWCVEYYYYYYYYYSITSRDAMENDATQTRSIISKYQLISQPKLDKFQLQYYSKRSLWRPLVFTQQRRRLCATDRQRRRSLSLKPYFTWKRRLPPGNGVRCPST